MKSKVRSLQFFEKKRKKKQESNHLPPSSRDDTIFLRAISTSFHAPFLPPLENTLEGRGAGRPPRCSNTNGLPVSLGSARPREPVNTEIMQRDNSSPLPSPQYRQTMRLKICMKRKRSTEERRRREQKATTTTIKSMGKWERRMGEDLGTGGEREREREQLEAEGQGNNARLVDVGVSYWSLWLFPEADCEFTPTDTALRVRDRHLHKQCILIS